MLDPVNQPVDDYDTPPPVTFVDMAPLIHRLRESPAMRSAVVHDVGRFDIAAFVSRTGFAVGGPGSPEVVLASQVAVELGHPCTASEAFLLMTTSDGLVTPGRISCAGPDVSGLGKGPEPLGQIVLLQIARDRTPDPFDLENAQYLTHRLPGYMVRSLPGRLWVRISRGAAAAGLTLETVGQALIAAYLEFEGVEGVEVVFITASEEAVASLAPIAREAKILAGQHKKLVLSPDGGVECTDLHCEECEERTVCDALRDVIVKRRQRRQGTEAGWQGTEAGRQGTEVP